MDENGTYSAGQVPEIAGDLTTPELRFGGCEALGKDGCCCRQCSVSSFRQAELLWYAASSHPLVHWTNATAF